VSEYILSRRRKISTSESPLVSESLRSPRVSSYMDYTALDAFNFQYKSNVHRSTCVRTFTYTCVPQHAQNALVQWYLEKCSETALQVQCNCTAGQCRSSNVSTQFYVYTICSQAQRRRSQPAFIMIMIMKLVSVCVHKEQTFSSFCTLRKPMKLPAHATLCVYTFHANMSYVSTNEILRSMAELLLFSAHQLKETVSICLSL
jgi:hypothetical protein